VTAKTRTLGHSRLLRAVRRSPALSHAGLREALFSWLFSGLVYPQIWEDPDVDIQALAITPDSHVVAIASGGCNILSYLTAGPAKITAIDLNSTHVALNRLKIAGARHLPNAECFYNFFGRANDAANIDAYWRHLAPALDAETRSYWEGRGGFGARRISIFARNAYRFGLLGRFIGLGHLLARCYGVDPRDMLRARSRADQRVIFENLIAPLFDKAFIRWAASCHVSLFGLGIPPAQYEVLAGDDDMVTVLRERLRKLACNFDLTENYFAWQAFGRGYAPAGDGPLPPYLQRGNFDCIRERAGRIDVLNSSFTEYLEGQPARSLDRYVLLDAQDWMSDAQLNALWQQMTRTARPGARVIFRTAARPSLLPGRLDPALLTRWRYEAGASSDFTARDRSAIYGGFHLYVLEQAS